MKRIFIALVVAFVGINMTCARFWAQATAQISGTVKSEWSGVAGRRSHGHLDGHRYSAASRF